MAQDSQEKPQAQDPSRQPDQLRDGTYEIIRNRLTAQSQDLQRRVQQINEARKAVFGAVDTTLLASERISTQNNCVPRDMIPVGDKFIFGYNVFIGLRTETRLEDVFAVYEWKDRTFVPASLDLITNAQFEVDFKNLYKYYKNTRFSKFSIIRNHLFMVFQVGRTAKDIKTFKWLIGDHGTLQYCDNRSDHEYVFPPQHEFEWRRVTQDMHRMGKNPHISVEDRVFVEAIRGDLTIKIEDNTETGEGIYSEPVDNPDQTLSDAEIYYAIIGHVILLKIKPYQESKFRFFLYNEKLQKAIRLDAIRDSCVLLPQDHGIIFSRGYYRCTGVLKQFDVQLEGMIYEKRFESPNGEDFLYVFHQPDHGVYILLSYNIIDQQVSPPIICSGFSLFNDGTLTYFRANDEAKKHHAIQIWQTSYYGLDFKIPVKSNSQLYKIGNKDIVNCMAECHEVMGLIAQEDVYVGLYMDISRKAEEVRDSYFWVSSPEMFKLSEPLDLIKRSADAAIDEYEKVVRAKRHAADQIGQTSQKVRQAISQIDYAQLNHIDTFVQHLTKLLALRGEAISLNDLQYADTKAIESLESTIAENTAKLSELCMAFLLQERSLDPYQEKIRAREAGIGTLQKASEAREAAAQIDQLAGELDTLTEIVSNLKTADATESVKIIDHISGVYAKVNQVKSALKNRLKELGRTEGKAEFGAQLKLIDQTVLNYLDLCATPEKCDEYLTKVIIQIETVESRFSDFEEFVGQLTEKREELYNAFESRKIQLVAERNQRTSALMTSAERILKGIRNRAAGLGEINAINGFFASDLMIDKIRQTAGQLIELGDSVKADDLKSRLKTIHQDTVRQLKDKQTLYEDGENIIRFGNHRFSVNRQSLEGTIVHKDDQLYFHLTGTGFLEPIGDGRLEETRPVWTSTLLCESRSVYRSEYLAFKMLTELCRNGELAAVENETPEQTAARVQAFMGPRYEEGYIKGVHDLDAVRILRKLVEFNGRIGLLRYSTAGRALATVFWRLCGDDTRRQLNIRIKAMGRAGALFGQNECRHRYIEEIRQSMAQFVQTSGLFPTHLVEEAGEYLFHELCDDDRFVVSPCAAEIKKEFELKLRTQGVVNPFASYFEPNSGNLTDGYRLVRDWVYSYLLGQNAPEKLEYADEAAALFLPGREKETFIHDVSIACRIENMVGSHELLKNAVYELNYCHFMKKIGGHEQTFVPMFRNYLKRRNELIETYKEELHLDDFQPRVLTTFVRNKLIDQIYLPLIGDNLAKQIGAEGQDKRTDRQGLLLLISPPGYGKTTLMEYVANRLGLIFVKINGPSLGSKVHSFDPAEAPNAASREELRKLNLAFEMGDNVMIYVDDIQHTHPEFLQRFISLCDAQRRVEGVYKGKARTYDLRGKRVAVVMAGNPYTESGEKFRIPDMLLNRANVYNIGDIVGDNYDQFVSSYIENCLTSVPSLDKLARRSQQDVYTIMRIAETGQQEGLSFEGNYSAEELNEHIAVMKKLYAVRQVVLNVNREYIRSAGQADAYRTEPPFLLQGSYRNMNRIAARIVPIMNDDELWTLIYSTYEQDAQTLTTGSEANLLKFRQLTGRLSPEQTQRWEDIKKTFVRNKLLGSDSEDNISRIIRQLNAFGAGLDSIKDVIADGVRQTKQTGLSKEEGSDDELKETGREVLRKMGEMIAEIKTLRTEQSKAELTQLERKTKKDMGLLTSVLEEQFHAMETWLLPLSQDEKKSKARVIDDLLERFEIMVKGYTKLIEVLKSKYHK